MDLTPPPLVSHPARPPHTTSDDDKPPRRPWLIGALAACLFLLCLVSGIVTFALLDDNGHHVADDDTSGNEEVDSDDGEEEEEKEEEDGATNELDLDMPFQNLSCAQEHIVLLASTDSPSAYEAVISEAGQAEPDASYLYTDESCSGIVQETGGRPLYAAYLGPFNSQAEACTAMRNTEALTSEVALLTRDRSQARPLCVCRESAESLPRIDPGVGGSSALGHAVRELQDALRRAGHTASVVDGVSDAATVSLIKAYQAANDLPVDGWVGPVTWGALLDDPQVCP
ncbi:MAG: peptidoglycan-binding domain-containing protein [Aeromicrobium sp.]|uniref:peptidoglycan-binding domain-containing protein n=1 Tax=Aeromicrobium sp. TaxID=1871063 RepID=UPI0039E3BDA3